MRVSPSVSSSIFSGARRPSTTHSSENGRWLGLEDPVEIGCERETLECRGSAPHPEEPRPARLVRPFLSAETVRVEKVTSAVSGKVPQPSSAMLRTKAVE